MKKSCLLLVLLLIRANAQPPSLRDPFLDNFVGDWKVERSVRKKPAVQTSVHCEWVLNHQFIVLHYGAVDTKPEYEAFVYIGYDDTAKDYVCHWVDIFGAKDSELGRGTVDAKLSALELKFGNGELTNRFTFDPQTKAWTSLIRQTEKGQWITFAEEKWVKQ